MRKKLICVAILLVCSCTSSLNYEKLEGSTLLDYENEFNLKSYKSWWEINPEPDQEEQEVTYFLEKGNLHLYVTSNPNEVDCQ